MNWKIIGRSLTHKDMRGRILVVLGILLVFRILAHIPVPLANPETLHQVLQNLFNSENTPQLLSFINVLSGGALANFSIMIAGQDVNKLSNWGVFSELNRFCSTWCRVSGLANGTGM